MEDGHARRMSVPVGCDVGFYHPKLQGRLENPGHPHLAVCLHTTRTAHVIVVDTYTHHICLPLLHIVSLAAEVTHIDRAFKLLAIFHRIRHVHVCECAHT